MMDHNGMIMMANSTLANMLGISAGNMHHNPFSKFVQPVSQHVFFSNLGLVAKSRRPLEMELLLAANSHRPIPVLAEMESVSSSPLGYQADERQLTLMTLNDITKLKSAQRLIQQAKKQWELTFDSVSELIAIIDENHRIKRVNLALAEKIGKTPEACIDKPCYEIFHQSDAPPEYCPHAQLMKDGTPHQIEHYEAVLNGHYLTSVSPFDGGSDGGKWCVCVSHEITDLKALEEERLENERKIQRLQKIEAIGTLAGGVAHDFNNILSIILGNIELSLDDLPGAHPVWSNLNEVHKATLRAQSVVRQLLSFARESHHQKKTFHIGADQYIEKPVDLKRLAIAARAALEQT
jgi:PAS domain S-box-containing protein